jgi:protoheme IX farnesyltransferase
MAAIAQSTDETAALEKRWPATYAELLKPRLTTLVVLTTLVGFYLGSVVVDYLRMLHAVLGTALVAGGAAALNQLIEREHDAKMHRTATRPLPSGRLQPGAVLIFGGACSATGLVYLALAVNLLTALLGAATLLCYLFIYTPLKRVTWLNTAIGAIPGALPPLMGWTAARDEVSLGGWALFGILFFWQLPHFLAIAWIYRDEYAKAGFVMLPLIDKTGERTGRQAVSHTLGLLPISLLPFALYMTGKTYLFGALALGIFFLVRSLQFNRKLDVPSARRLFFASIIYLPLLLILLVMDKNR